MPIQYVLQAAVSLDCLFSFCSVQLWDYNAKIYGAFAAYILSSEIIFNKLSLLRYAYKFVHVAFVTWFQHMLLQNVPVCHLCFGARERFLYLHSCQPYLFACILFHLENWDNCIGLILWTSTWHVWANYTRDFLKSCSPNMEGWSKQIVCSFSASHKQHRRVEQLQEHKHAEQGVLHE